MRRLKESSCTTIVKRLPKFALSLRQIIFWFPHTLLSKQQNKVILNLDLKIFHPCIAVGINILFYIVQMLKNQVRRFQLSYFHIFRVYCFYIKRETHIVEC